MSETVKDRVIVTITINMKLYVTYRIAAIHPMTSSDFVIHLLHAFQFLIFYTVVKQLTSRQLTHRAARSLCDIWNSLLVFAISRAASVIY